MSKVKCINCNFIGEEEELQWVSEEIGKPETDYKACPKCLTDSFLMEC